jgi:DNA-binding XRE family transcriptional regulator
MIRKHKFVGKSKRKRKAASPIVAAMIRGFQIRAGRALCAMKQTTLAELAGITPTGLAAIEKGFADPRATTLDRLVRALQAEGVVFIDDDIEPGVKASPELAARLRGGAK